MSTLSDKALIERACSDILQNHRLNTATFVCPDVIDVIGDQLIIGSYHDRPVTWSLTDELIHDMRAAGINQIRSAPVNTNGGSFMTSTHTFVRVDSCTDWENMIGAGSKRYSINLSDSRAEYLLGDRPTEWYDSATINITINTTIPITLNLENIRMRCPYLTLSIHGSVQFAPITNNCQLQCGRLSIKRFETSLEDTTCWYSRRLINLCEQLSIQFIQGHGRTTLDPHIHKHTDIIMLIDELINSGTASNISIARTI